MSWFRVHNDILENPKLLMVAPSDRWYFTSILSLKSQGVLDDFEGEKLDRVIAAKLRLTLAEWEETSRRLQEEALIDAKYQPIGWDRRQYKSDSSTERVRKHREKKKSKQKGSGGETLHETPVETLHETLQGRDGNGGVAPPDTDTDTDTDKTSSEPIGSAASAAKPVDNSRLDRLGIYYDHPDQELNGRQENLFSVGVRVFAKYKVPDQRARAVLGMLVEESGKGPVLDALTELVCCHPGSGDPVADMRTLLSKPRKPMPKEWQPSGGALSNLKAVGIPDNVVSDARATFRLWVQEREATSSDFDEWFKRWVVRDFEDAQLDIHVLGSWYRGAAAKEFREPPGGYLDD